MKLQELSRVVAQNFYILNMFTEREREFVTGNAIPRIERELVTSNKNHLQWPTGA
jgi:hypothetical protein